MDEYMRTRLSLRRSWKRVLRVLNIAYMYHPVIFSLISGDVEYLSFITESHRGFFCPDFLTQMEPR